MITKAIRKKMSMLKLGNRNPRYQKDETKLSPHYWIVMKKSKANAYICELCKKPAFDWSNKDHKYRKNLKDWQSVCKSCHRNYDYKLRKINKIKETKEFKEARKMPGFSEEQYLEMILN